MGTRNYIGLVICNSCSSQNMNQSNSGPDTLANLSAMSITLNWSFIEISGEGDVYFYSLFSMMLFPKILFFHLHITQKSQKKKRCRKYFEETVRACEFVQQSWEITQRYCFQSTTRGYGIGFKIMVMCS